MERLARLNGTYGRKGTYSWRSPVRSDGLSRQSIDSESTQCTRIQVSLLHRHVVLLIVNSLSFISWLLSSTLQVTPMMIVHCQESDGCSKLAV